MSGIQGDRPLRIAVVGAGIAGLACARELQKGGVRVTVFERDMQPGGRLGAAESASGSYDGGAQFLTLHSGEFAPELRAWVNADVVRTWEARVVHLVDGLVRPAPSGPVRMVGVPNMRAIANHLARDLDLACLVDIDHLVRTPTGWLLFDRMGVPVGNTPFDAVALAMPSAHALPIARDAGNFAARLHEVAWNACWVTTVVLSRASTIEFDAAFIDDDPILGWAARDSSKPMRKVASGIAERWVLQARPAWSNSFASLPATEACRWMQRAFAARLGLPLAQRRCTATRWAVSTPANCLPDTHLWDPAEGLGCAGDWLGSPHIEGAFLSGRSLARAILGT